MFGLYMMETSIVNVSIYTFYFKLINMHLVGTSLFNASYERSQ